MKYYVYYSDDFWEMGGVGFESFESKSDALMFVQMRYDDSAGGSGKASLDNYILIEGKRLELSAAEVVTKIVVDVT